MSGNFFDRLEGELAGLTTEGTHLDDASQRRRRLVLMLSRRILVALALALVLAVSLASEFPASAGGQVLAAHAPVSRVL